MQRTYKGLIVKEVEVGGPQDYSIEDGLMTRTLKTYSNDRITTLGYRSLYSYAELEELYLPNVETIGSYACYGCTSLKKVYIPNASVIETNFLCMATSLKEITFDKLIRVNEIVRNCTSLEYIEFKVATSINGGCFADDAALKTLIIRTPTVCTVQSNSFNRSGIALGTGFVYVPDELVDSYKSATNWSVYATQIKPLSELEQG